MLEDHLAKVDRFVTAKEWRLLHHRIRGKLRYQSLSGRHQEPIRLLLLYPKSAGEEIHCRFVNAGLDNPPRYEALSYTWGNPFANPYAVKNGTEPKGKTVRQYEAWFKTARNHDVFVDGCRVSVGQNLFDGLQNIRDDKHKKLIWVDALCINQDDDDERRHQVSIMNMIYRNARIVFVWLGPETTLSELSRTQSDLYDGCVSTDPSSRSRGILFARVCTSSWFQRLWIVQEIAVATDILFRCGSINIELWEMDALLPGAKHIDYISIGLETETDETIVNRAIRGFSRVAAVRSLIDRVRLETLVYCWRFNRCRDPRDRVYALLSIARQPNGRLMLEPDYRVTLEELSKSLVFTSIQTHGTLDALRYSNHLNETGKTPSWAFTLTVGIEQEDGQLTKASDGDTNNIVSALEAARPHPLRRPPVRSIVSGRDVLQTSGRVVLNIELIGETVYDTQHQLRHSPTADEFHATKRFEVRTSLSTEDAASFRKFIDSRESYDDTGKLDHERTPTTTSTPLLKLHLYMAGMPQSSRPYTRLRHMYEHEWLTWDWVVPEFDQFADQAASVFERYCNARFPGEIVGNRRVALASQSPLLQPASQPAEVNGDENDSHDPESGLFHVIVPKLTQPGDVVVMLSHTRNPFILRPLSVESTGQPVGDEPSIDPTNAFELIGACYLERRLDWEAFEELGTNELDDIYLY